MKNEKIDIKWLYAAGLAALGVCIIFYFRGILPGGNYCLLTGDDLYMQYAAFSNLLSKKLLEGSNLFYASNLGMGGNIAFLIAFYVMSPANICYLFIKDLTLATMCVLLIKAAITALVFQLYCRFNLNSSNAFSVIFSVSYAIGSFYFYVLQMNVLYDALYLLPLVFMALNAFVKKGNNIFLLLSYMLLFFSNFYCTYIVGLVSFGYFIYLLLENKNKIKLFSLYVIICAISLLCSSLVLLPALSVAFSTTALSDSFIYEFPNILKFLRAFAAGKDYYLHFSGTDPNVYCGLITAIFFISFFFNKKILLKTRMTILVLAVLFAISFYIPIIYKFMHMFNRPDGYTARYAYLMPFLMCSVAVIQSNYIEDVIKKYKNVCVYSLIFVLYLGVLYNGYHITTFYPNISQDYFDYSFSEAKAITETMNQADQGEYRIQLVNNMNLNLPIILDYKGMISYSSADSSGYRSTLEKLGLSNTEFMLKEFGSTDVSKMIFGEKYIVRLSSMDNPYSGIISINTKLLNLGYLVNNNILDTKLDDNNVFTNINNLMKGMTNIDNTFELAPMYNVSIDDTTFNYDADNNIVIELSDLNGDGAGKTRFILEDRKMRTFSYFSNIYESNFNNAAPFIYSETDPIVYYGCYSKTSDPHITELDKGENEYTIDILMNNTTDKKVTFDNIYFAYQNDDKIEEEYDYLKENQLNITKFEDGHIIGDIRVDSEDKSMLFLSVPYEKGWIMYVDGEKHDIIPLVDDSFIGAKLPDGEHQIELIFEAPMAKEGLWLSIAGFLSAIVLIAYSIYKNKSIQEKVIER